MKGTLFSKFLGVTSICCFSAATLCAVDELRQQSLEMLVVDQNGSGIFPKVFKAAAAVKNSPDPISKILYAPGEISLLGGPVELKAKNSISSITITPASGVPIFKAKLVGISPEMIQNEKIASMANPAIQVTKGVLELKGGLQLTDISFKAIASDLSAVKKDLSKISETRLSLIGSNILQNYDDSTGINVIGAIGVVGDIGASNGVSFTNLAQKAIRYEVTAGSLTLTNVSFAAGKHYFQANPGGTLDMAQVQFSSGASTPRIAASGVDAVVKIGSELSVFTPNNIRNRPVFFIKNGGEIAFTDNFNVENYIQSGTSSLILEMLKGKSTGLANNLGRINIGYGKTVSLGKISIELPATGKGPLTLSKTGLGDLYINGVDIIDYDRKSFNKVLSQAFAVYSTSPSNHSGNLLSFALRNGLIDKKNASNTLEVLNEAIACNIIKTAYNLTLIDDAREIVFDGEFDCDSEFVVNKLRDATLLTRQNQTDLATIVGQKPYLSEHQVARAFDRLQQHDYIAARLSGELALANGSTLLTLGNFVGSDNIGFSMKPGSYLIATSDVMLNGSSEIVRATILSTSGNVYLRGNLMEHRFIGAQIDPLSHVILYENGRIASSGSVFDSDVEISPNAIFLSGTDGRGSLATKAQGIAAVNSFTNLITGDFTLRDNSKLALLVKSDGSSEGVDVNGSLIIGDGVKALLLPADGCFSKKIKTAILVKAASVTGSFDGAISSSDLLKVQLVKNDISGGGTQYSINFQRMDLTEIAALRDVVPAKMLIAMDNLLDRAADSPALYSKLAKLKLLSSFDVLGVIQGVQPSQLKALAMSQENNAVNVRNTLSIRFQRELDAMHCASSATPSGKCDVKAKPVHVWATGFGDNMYQGQVSDYGYGFQNNMGGFSAGVDYHFADVLYAGALGAYTSSDIDWLNGYGSGDITTGYAGVYMSAISKMYWGTIAVLGGWSDYSSDRNFFLQNNRLNFSNSHNGSQILSHADTGINLGFKGFTIRPFDSFDYISQTENSFHEKGNGTFNLEIDDQTSIMIRNELGINFAGCFCIKGMQWTVSPKISWVREVRVKGKTINAEFEDVDQSFEVDGYFPSRSLVSPGITLQGNFKDDLFTVGLYYNGVFQGNYSDHSYGGQIRFGF